MEEQRKPGRPLKFASVKKLAKLIDDYFKDCDPHMVEITEWVEARDTDGKLLKDKNGLNYLVEVTHKVMTQQKPYTVTGLAVWLGTSRETLINYGEKEQYFDTIKAAKDRCEHFAEQQLYTANNVTGTIFSLKNNWDWKDKSEVETRNLDVNKLLEDLEDDNIESSDSEA